MLRVGVGYGWGMVGYGGVGVGGVGGAPLGYAPDKTLLYSTYSITDPHISIKVQIPNFANTFF